ncbi:hypothetical protein E1B28_013885 [Marasmius oreades]|uniref:Uncharacterized protein n=1 Tax=Marasmius oreades TaxID=181124 RepID=A0A9P7RK02_9AGAR|nr:uncharacterized protein E1B28_013885 [Marasmius oreades]KAG7085272.1 hypothetical protein E1B28_013885 [Marasmius oreades]
MMKNGFTKIEATPEAEQNWRGMVMGIYDKLLMKNARGWWNGANIPGKAVEVLSFPGAYRRTSTNVPRSWRTGMKEFNLRHSHHSVSTTSLTIHSTVFGYTTYRRT